jgi:uncharacterized membrane protein
MIVRTLALWLHVASTITWFGGLFFYLLVADPAARAGERRERAVADLDQRFRHLAWGSVEFAVVTGIALFVITLLQAGTTVGLSGAYHRVFGVKMLLAVAVIALQLYNHVKINPRKRALAESPGGAAAGAGSGGAAAAPGAAGAAFDALQARTRQIFSLELILGAVLVLLGVHLRAV